MTRKFKFCAAAILAASVVACSNPNAYKVTADIPADAEITKAYLYDYDADAAIDSALVVDGKLTFAGEVDSAIVVRMYINDNSRPSAEFILEPGEIVLDEDFNATGTPLNARMVETQKALEAIIANMDTCQSVESRNLLAEKFYAEMDKQIEENIDNPIGYSFLVYRASEMTPVELEIMLAKNPALRNTKRIGSVVEKIERKYATSEGQKFIDFDINGEKLSDYVGKDGKYLLVDFWASWCGPCIRQTAVIKDIYAKYKDKLNVLGVAVWDKVDDTKKAIEQHKLSWPCIMDAQRIPTDLYGISGIPCIILISPDGTILSRDKQSEELITDVEKYLGK